MPLIFSKLYVLVPKCRNATILTMLLDKGPEETIATIQSWKEQLQLLYTMVGQTRTQDLTNVSLIFSGSVKDLVSCPAYFVVGL